MSQYRDKPWLSAYGALPTTIGHAHANALDMFMSSREGYADNPLIHYFYSTLTVKEVDVMSDALAVYLAESGVVKGDRVAVYLQNMPQFVLTMLACWKLGAVLVSVNPMYRHAEVKHILKDSGAIVLVTLQSLYKEVIETLQEDTSLVVVIATSELDFLDEQVPPLLHGIERLATTGTRDFLEIIEEYKDRQPDAIRLTGEDLALLTYTSGTTGPAKGAMISHANIVFNSELLRIWIDLSPGDPILAIPPLFHATGLIACITTSFVVPSPLILFYRFDTKTAAELIEYHKVRYTAGAITAFSAFLNSADVDIYDLSSLTKVHSGGAPISATVVNDFEKKFGVKIYPAYGMTETTATAVLAPFGSQIPVDKKTETLSVGVPVSDVEIRIIDEQGNDMPLGEAGELTIKSPGVVSGYWQQAGETANTIINGELRTGDIGFMDENGWIYLIDRKKDLIITSGYKVWPREVEDVLYQHAVVREAAVIGVPDEYRGEAVKAFVSLKANAISTEEELINHCREQLAAYKRPGNIEILDDLPKSPSGKILRRELR